MNTVHVVDYGVGNIHNVVRALKHLGFHVVCYQWGVEFESPQCVVLPGVGAFGDCIAALTERGFVEPLQAYVKKGGALLGICVGMHLLADVGEEFGLHKGLGLIQGRVQALRSNFPGAESIKIPHIAWSALHKQNECRFAEPFFSHEFYFLHSYKFCCENKNNEIACAFYESLPITAVVRHKNILGVQFHPERSGVSGLEFLKNWVNLSCRVETAQTHVSSFV